MPDQDGFLLPTDIYPTYDLIRSGGAFENRVAEHIAELQAKIADQVVKLQVLSDAVDSPPPSIPNWTDTDLDNLIIELGVLSGFATDLLSHTNRLCGVTISFQSQLPNVFTLLSTSDALKEIEAKIEEGSGGTEPASDPTEQFFGSLVSMPDRLDIMADFINDLDKKIDFEQNVLLDAEPYASDPEHEQPLPTATIATIAGYWNEISNIIATENQNFEDAITKMIRWSFSEFLLNPTIVWRDFLVNYMATSALASMIPEVEE